MWIDVQQNTDEWEQLRLGKVTASGASKFMANYGKAFEEPAKRYAVEIALQRITGIKTESFSNDHTERGHAQEPIARALYEEETFQTVGNGGFFDYKTHGVSPDGLVKGGIVEIKSVIATTHYANLKRGSFDPAYRWQIASQLNCEGIEFVDFCSYCADFPQGKQLLIYTVTCAQFRDEIERLIERREKFLEFVNTIEVELRD